MGIINSADVCHKIGKIRHYLCLQDLDMTFGLVFVIYAARRQSSNDMQLVFINEFIFSFSGSMHTNLPLETGLDHGEPESDHP